MDVRDHEDLIARVREHVGLEIAGDIEGLYAFIDPARRAKREERDDEPDVTRDVMQEFVDWVHSASILELDVSGYVPADPRRGERPSAKVHTKIEYNDLGHTYDFNETWVRDDGTWFTTSMGKIRPGPAIMF